MIPMMAVCGAWPADCGAGVEEEAAGAVVAVVVGGVVVAVGVVTGWKAQRNFLLSYRHKEMAAKNRCEQHAY
jgi:hypothetical protein